MNNLHRFILKLKYFAELIYVFVIFCVLSNLYKTQFHDSFYEASLKIKLFYFLHFITLSIALFLLIKRQISKESLLKRIYFKAKNLILPKALKIILIIILFGNFICVLVGKSVYPFSNVGMFSRRIDFKKQNKSETVYRLKYYYYENDNLKILDVRKESYFFLSDKLGLGYNHEYTFSTTFHNKKKKENFEFLMNSLDSKNIDTLWVGVQTVNFETKKTSFNPDICNAILLNTNERYYGELYIPDYQIKKCDGN